MLHTNDCAQNFGELCNCNLGRPNESYEIAAACKAADDWRAGTIVRGELIAAFRQVIVSEDFNLGLTTPGAPYCSICDQPPSPPTKPLVRDQAVAMMAELYKKEPKPGDSVESGYVFYIDPATEKQLETDIMTEDRVFGPVLQGRIRKDGLRATLSRLYGFPTKFDAEKFELKKEINETPDVSMGTRVKPFCSICGGTPKESK